MARSVLITGLGPATAWGLGADALERGAMEGRCAIGPIRAFDPSAYRTRIAGELPQDFKVAQHVPKSYRKAAKVMARDIEIAAACADLAVRDAGLLTPATDPEAAKAGTLEPTYPPQRVGCHIGAGLIAVDPDEITAAFATAVDPDTGRIDMHAWGREGMSNLTPLWLLKYLPNMLACHVTILHDCRGPSNTITCNESSAGLSVGESFRVIERGQADACLCGGAESKLNSYAFFRQELNGRMTDENDRPATACRPFDRTAAGQVVAEGGAVLVLEARETFRRRLGQPTGSGDRPAEPYARVLGVSSTQTVNREARNTVPDPQGLAIAAAMRDALADASLAADDIDAVFAYGIGQRDYDAAEAAALLAVFGDRLTRLPVISVKPWVGNCGAGSGGVDLALAALCLRRQQLPAVVNRADPLPGMGGERPALGPGQAALRNVLIAGTGLGGQNTVTVLGRC